MNYILDFADHMTNEEVAQYAATNNITILKQFDAFGQVYLGACNAEPITNDLLITIVKDDDDPLALLSFNIDLRDSTDVTVFSIEDEKNWWKVASMNNVDFDSPTVNHARRGEHSCVYLVDSGINTDHPDFINSKIELLHTFTEDFNDVNGHGTALASLIVGETCSLTNTKLKVVKIFEQGIPTRQSDLLNALSSIIADYNTSGKVPSVVNMSWTIPFNSYINEKIQFLIDQGIFVVCAAGNNGLPIADVTPACIRDVIVVGSYSQNLEPSDFSSYTGQSEISVTSDEVNYGELDGWAPGEQIWAAKNNGTYGFIAGTSASSAIAAGALVYNIELWVADESVNYIVDSSIRKELLKSKQSLTLRRPGLLTMSETYSSSDNKIVTYLTSTAASTGNSTGNIFKAQAGSKYVVLYASPNDYTNIQCDNLPDYVTVTEHGFLVIEHPEIEEPYIIMPNILFTLTLKNGWIVERQVTLIIYKQDMEYIEAIAQASDPEDEQILSIVMLNTCSFINNQCQGTCDNPKTCQEVKGACYCL
jgi:hypothetical protein